MCQRVNSNAFVAVKIECWELTLTLGTREDALLLTSGDSTVDVALEGSLGKVVDLVVGLDILLDSLTAVEL